MKPATVHEIRAHYPKAPADLVLACLERELTLAQIGDAIHEELAAENDRLTARITDLQTQLDGLGRSRGQRPKTPMARATSDYMRQLQDEWAALVQKHLDAGLSKRSAIAAAAAEDPLLYQAVMAESNRLRRRNNPCEYFPA